jgi:hypothetical protein
MTFRRLQDLIDCLGYDDTLHLLKPHGFIGTAISFATMLQSLVCKMHDQLSAGAVAVPARFRLRICWFAQTGDARCILLFPSRFQFLRFSLSHDQNKEKRKSRQDRIECLSDFPIFVFSNNAAAGATANRCDSACLLCSALRLLLLFDFVVD